MMCSLHRWGNTPLDEAVHFGHSEVATILQKYQEQYTPPAGPTGAAGATAGADSKESTEKSLDSLL